MDSFTKNIKHSLIILSILVSTHAPGEQLSDNILNVLELSENRDTLLKYNGNHQILDLSKYNELSNIKVIGREAFAYNLKIKEIILPHNIQVIGNGAFVGCKKLTRICMPDSVEHIGASAFWECSALKMSELPRNLKTIDENAFVGCSNISFTEIPDGVTTIGKRAFAYCDDLTSIKLSPLMETISRLTFFKCINLNTIDIPESIRLIGHNAFYGCEQLKELFLPKDSGNPFARCSHLKSVYITSMTFVTPYKGLYGTETVNLNSNIFLKY